MRELGIATKRGIEVWTPFVGTVFVKKSLLKLNIDRRISRETSQGRIVAFYRLLFTGL